MSNHRISNAIDSLIGHLIPANPREDEETSQARHDDCFELVRSILETSVLPHVFAEGTRNVLPVSR